MSALSFVCLLGWLLVTVLAFAWLSVSLAALISVVGAVVLRAEWRDLRRP